MAQHDFTQITNQIISKWDGETDEEHFMRVTSIKVAAFFEADRPRCCDCEHLNNHGICNQYRSKVENEYLYTANDCEHYIPNIPF